jgi:hypothetical protein
VFLSFKANCLKDAIGWDKVNQFLRNTTIGDLKVSTFGFALEDFEKSRPLIFLTFRRFTPHTEIFKEHLTDGVVPNQELIDNMKSLRTQLKELAISNEDASAIEALDKLRSFMVLEATAPNSKWLNDAGLLSDIAQAYGGKRVQYIEGKMANWLLKDFGYKKRGGASRVARDSG